MTQRERAYNRKLEELIGKVGRLNDSEVARALEMLEDARKEIASLVFETEWQAYRIPQLQAAVDRAIDTFRRRYADRLGSAQANMWSAGIDLVDGPLRTAGFSLAAPEISLDALSIMQGYSADLVGGLAADALKSVNTEITMGILGEKTPWQVMQGIGKNLDGPWVFGKIATRAEVIARTELARVNSTAREARIRAVVESNPGEKWMKKWLSSGKFHPRPHHAALHGVSVPVKENFPGGIPYPHAPGLPAAEVVNCGCTHALTLMDWEKESKDWEALPYGERAIYD